MVGTDPAGWQRAVARAMRSPRRPIETSPRFTPRLAGRSPPGLPARSAARPARLAGALLLLYPDGAGRPTIPLTKRRGDLRAHPGEVSLPGGAVDAGDASAEAAALREAREEIGLEVPVTVIGMLDDIWIPVSNFELRTFVATTDQRPALHPSEAEVESILELPLASLLTDEIVEEDEIAVRGGVVRAAFYRYSGERIWGATARALSMLVAVLLDAGLSESDLLG